jgi:hypothetical protein
MLTKKNCIRRGENVEKKNTGFRKILLGCHIPALSVSSLQK